MSSRWNKILALTFKPPWLYSFLGIFIAFLAFNYWVNYLEYTIPSLISRGWFVPVFFFMIFVVALLVALNVNLILSKVIEFRKLHHSSGLSFLGAFAGILGGACPGCFVGLLPSIAGIFGVTTSLSFLPFYGLEVQALSILLLVIAAIIMTRTDVCALKK
ncbi:MAG: hypothetical protein ABIA93_02205 [Candidatus Woesearchaeota archaeon]